MVALSTDAKVARIGEQAKEEFGGGVHVDLVSLRKVPRPSGVGRRIALNKGSGLRRGRAPAPRPQSRREGVLDSLARLTRRLMESGVRSLARAADGAGLAPAESMVFAFRVSQSHAAGRLIARSDVIIALDDGAVLASWIAARQRPHAIATQGIPAAGARFRAGAQAHHA